MLKIRELLGEDFLVRSSQFYFYFVNTFFGYHFVFSVAD